MTRRSEVLVGVVIVLGLVLIVFGTVWLRGGGWGREEFTLQARFREVGQLVRGNAVKLRGVPIGRVEAIELEDDGEGVRIRMRIQRDAVLPQDPVVILSPESMFGDWQAEIFPRAQFPRYQYAESFRRGVLPGYSLPDISRLTAVADRIAENMAVLTDRIGVAFTEETALNIREAIDNFQEVSAQLTGMVATQQRTVDEVGQNLQALSERLNETADRINRTFAQVEAAVAEGELQNIVDNVERTTAQLDTMAAAMLSASVEFRSAMRSADSIFTPVAGLVSRMERGEGTLGRLIVDDTLFLSFIRTNAEMQALLRDFQANPRRYINLRIF
jgi:phospholipid/cholesterol/gamma-HCH transport system substrate-binding protein